MHPIGFYQTELTWVNSNVQLQKGMYYKWFDEGHICSITIQFDIDYPIEKTIFFPNRAKMT